jgi:hypothetical protein
MVVWCGLLIGFTLAVDVNNRPSLKRATSRFGLIAKQVTGGWAWRSNESPEERPERTMSYGV